MISFLKIGIKKIVLKIGSLINVNISKTETNNKQDIKNLNNIGTFHYQPIVLARGEQVEKLLSDLSTHNFSPQAQLGPGGMMSLPALDKSPTEKKLIEKFINENDDDPTFLLDAGRLLHFYKNRQNIDYTEEEIVLLVKSALKLGFPFWYWTFLYREKFGNVLPLLKNIYKTRDVKIRMNVIEVIIRFIGTSEELVELAFSENEKTILGKIIEKLFALKETEKAQRVIANSLSRKIIPVINIETSREYKAELGNPEKTFLKDTISGGWGNEKNEALGILALTASVDDLQTIDNIVEDREVAINALNCISKIGTTNKKEFLENELKTTKWYKHFEQILITLIAIDDKNILSNIFQWFLDDNKLKIRFSKFEEYHISDIIEKGIIKMVDEDFYEDIVRDILSYSKSAHKDVLTWRHFNLLGKIENKKIIKLLENESRLKDFLEWKNLLSEIEFKKTLKIKSGDDIDELVFENDYKQAIYFFRNLWKELPRNKVKNYKDKIDRMCNKLKKRLTEINAKNIPSTNLDFYLDVNNTYNYDEIRKAKKDAEKNDTDLFKLLDDISNFEIIEKEFLKHLLSEKDNFAKECILEYMGYPYEVIYENFDSEWLQSLGDEINEKLKSMAENEKNPLMKLEAYNAIYSMKSLDDDEIRIKVIEISLPAKEFLIENSSMNKDGYIRYQGIYYKACRVLMEIGNKNDLELIKDLENKNTILRKTYYSFSYFHHFEAVEYLINIIELLEDEKEKESASFALNRLDYNWTMKILKIKE